MGNHFATNAIHAGQHPDKETGGVVQPIYQTSTFAQDHVGQPRAGYEYSRSANPTRSSLEICLAALETTSEQETFATTFSSGLGAADTALRVLAPPGTHVLIGNDVYGGTFRLFDKVLTTQNITYTAVDLTNSETVEANIKQNTVAIWAETPSNPLLQIVDIKKLANLAHVHNLKLIVDNTFASPYCQQPLELNADVVLHSTTKYLGGHSDVIGGALIVKDVKLDEDFKFIQNATGNVLAPFEAWLTLRGIKTLAVRMQTHQNNALTIANWLQEHSEVSEVFYPGLTTHPNHEVASAQMTGFSGMVSFRLKKGVSKAISVCENTAIFTLAESLGGVESLIEIPSLMTHASTSGSLLEVPSDLVRLSVGIEHVDDLLNDLEQSLTK